MTLRNVVTVRHAGCERFLDRADRTPQRIGLTSPKVVTSGSAGQVTRTVPLSSGASYPIAEHYFSPRSLRILFTKPLPSSLRLPCMGNWDFRSPRRTVTCPLPPL